MLDYHSNKLLQIRQHALTWKALILHTYAYLRDAEGKGFYHESMTGFLWDPFATMSENGVESRGGSGGGGSGNSSSVINDEKGKGKRKGKVNKRNDDRKPWCSHCRNGKSLSRGSHQPRLPVLSSRQPTLQRLEL
jgi:hypothetical protein